MPSFHHHAANTTYVQHDLSAIDLTFIDDFKSQLSHVLGLITDQYRALETRVKELETHHNNNSLHMKDKDHTWDPHNRSHSHTSLNPSGGSIDEIGRTDESTDKLVTHASHISHQHAHVVVPSKQNAMPALPLYDGPQTRRSDGNRTSRRPGSGRKKAWETSRRHTPRPEPPSPGERLHKKHSRRGSQGTVSSSTSHSSDGYSDVEAHIVMDPEAAAMFQSYQLVPTNDDGNDILASVSHTLGAMLTSEDNMDCSTSQHVHHQVKITDAMFMMEYKANGFKWLDIIGNPDRKSDEYINFMSKLAKENDIHQATIKDCFMPFHLPKLERVGKWTFIILRYAKSIVIDKNIDAQPSISSLTHKLVMYISNDKLITIRRVNAIDDFPSVTNQIQTWHTGVQRDHLVNKFLDDVISTFRGFLDGDAEELELHEEKVDMSVNMQGRQIADGNIVWRLYHIQRDVAVKRRLVGMTSEVIIKFTKLTGNDPFREDLKDNMQSLVYEVESLHENVTQLLGLHLALIDHHQNHLLYVMTIFTVVFIPLTFIVGFYGMNLQMGEFNWSFGQIYVIVLLLFVVFLTLSWMKWKQFL